MACSEHLDILKEGAEIWNAWRKRNPSQLPDLGQANLAGTDLSRANLSQADLSKTDLRFADLTGANLHEAFLNQVSAIGADFSDADLSYADLRTANLSEAQLNTANFHQAFVSSTNFHRANLSKANLIGLRLMGTILSGANLSEAQLKDARLDHADLSIANLRFADLDGASLPWADLAGADLSGAKLRNADLTGASLVETNLENADITGCRVYGISAWNVRLSGTIQKNLVITRGGESTIQVDRLDMAQFIYLLLNNAEIRHVIDTVTSKVVLILGRFTHERKAVLDALRSVLRQHDYLPILFDWEKPSNRDITETVSTLAHMAKFVVADITDAKSIPQELMAIVPNLPSVPVQPLLIASQREYGMFEHFKRYPWVLPIVIYDSTAELLSTLELKILAPAESKLRDLASGYC